MLRFLLLCLLINVILGAEDGRVVILDEGGVQGEKYWNGDFYEFYGVPYASVPKGRDRFQGPLPPEPWNAIMPANSRTSRCFQSYLTEDSDEPMVDGEEECLVMNLLVPKVANETNLVPVVAYIHSGAFSGGNGNMAQFHYLARHDIIVISFNYRLGALGFACLGNKEVPGNAGMKDQVAALKWIKKNIRRFGGDPRKVTVAGFSVGATMAELLALSKTTDGLIDKIILESGSALSPFAINRDPVSTARNIAISVGYKDTGSLRDLTEFYLTSSYENLSSRSQHFFLPNSTFGFSPCIENEHEGIEAFLTESPIDIIRKGKNKPVAVLTGFANMEGISRSVKFNEWSDKMNEKFDDFLPADLKFDDVKEKEKVITKIKNHYFKGEEVTHDTLEGYIDYFSDSMFKYGILKSAKEHAEKQNKPIYLYEFSYVGELSMKHYYMDKLKGASHRDQSAYILDFFGWTNKPNDLDMRDRMTMMWSDFIKYEDPTAYESDLTTFKWLKFTKKDPNYLRIGTEVKMDKDLFENGFKFWDELYNKYYWDPKPPKIVIEEPEPVKISEDKTKERKDTPASDKSTKKSDTEPTLKDQVPEATEDKKPSKKIEIEAPKTVKISGDKTKEGKDIPKSDKGTKESDNEPTVKVKVPDATEDKKPNTIYVNDPKKSRERKTDAPATKETRNTKETEL